MIIIKTFINYLNKITIKEKIIKELISDILIFLYKNNNNYNELINDEIINDEILWNELENISKNEDELTYLLIKNFISNLNINQNILKYLKSILITILNSIYNT